MKINTIAFLIGAALLATLATAHESMIVGDDNEESGKRRLGFSGYGWQKGPDYYKEIYYRCCNTNPPEGEPSLNNPAWSIAGADEAGYPGPCRCPVRGSAKISWAWWSEKKSYYEKWQEACKPGGSIYTKAGFEE